MASESGKRGGGSGLVLAGMTAANAMVLVDQTAVPLAVRHHAGLRVGSQNVQWVLNASLLMLAGLPCSADARRPARPPPVFLAGCLLFSGGSAVAGLAPAFEVLIAARVVQGVGAH
ncbi:MAG: hypothetical protein R2699_00280 [Acidimicrobiales bacterium]